MPFGNPILAGEELISSGIRSQDYETAVEGWRVGKDGSAQFETLNVLHEVGADLVTADEITLGGDDLREYLEFLPKGQLTYARAYGTHTAEIASTETILFEFNGGAIKQGRIYRIHIHGHLDGSVAGDAFDFKLRYTADGSTPTISSAILDGSLTRFTIPTVNTSNAFQVTAYYVPANDYDVTKFSLTLDRVAGTGTAKIYLTDINRATEFMLEDCGLFVGTVTNGGGGILSQRSKYVAPPTTSNPTPTVPPPDPDPVQRYTRSWYAEWSRSYDEDDDTRAGDDTNDMYQGYYSGTHGRTFSLCGFNYSQIMSYLSGAKIISCKLTFKPKWIAGYGGLLVRINGHDYTSKPGSVDQGRVDENIKTRSNCAAGSSYTVDLGTTVGGKFKSGAFKGIGFGPAGAQDEYGRMYGEGSSSRPKLTIVYEK